MSNAYMKAGLVLVLAMIVGLCTILVSRIYNLQPVEVAQAAPAAQMSAPLSRFVVKLDEGDWTKPLPAGKSVMFMAGYSYALGDGTFDLVEFDLPVGFTFDDSTSEDASKLCKSKHISKGSQVQEIVICWNVGRHGYFALPFAIRKLP